MIGDVVKAIGPMILPFVEKCLTTFESQFMQIDRSLKMPLICGIGDCIREIHDPQMMAKHLPNVLAVVDVVVQACMHLNMSGEDAEYVDELRDALRDFFENLCSNIMRIDGSMLEPVLGATVSFVLNTSSMNANPS